MSAIALVGSVTLLPRPETLAGNPFDEPEVAARYEDLFDGLKQAFHRAAERGHVVMVATFSNACPLDPVANE